MILLFVRKLFCHAITFPPAWACACASARSKASTSLPVFWENTKHVVSKEIIVLSLNLNHLHKWEHWLHSGEYGGPHLPRQNLLFHGKTYFSTAKLTFPRQNLQSSYSYPHKWTGTLTSSQSLNKGKGLATVTYTHWFKQCMDYSHIIFFAIRHIALLKIPGSPTRESIGRDRLEARNGKVSFAVEK